MQINVAKAIKELLYTTDPVIIPGLGGFVSSPVSANVDYVQGSVEAPSKKIEFNPNLVINDGVLARYVAEKYTVSFREAVEAITNFVKEAKETLNRREIVEIPDVGRIYLDYQQQIRFMPDKTNFSTDSFGLPPVSFTPIVREATDKVPAAPTPDPAPVVATAADAPSHVQEMAPSFIKRNMPWLIGMGAVLLAVVLFIVFSNEGTDANRPKTDRINVSPKSELENEQLSDDASTPATENQDTTAYNDLSASPNNETARDQYDQTAEKMPQPPSATEVKEAFIVVHSFKNPRNATNFFNVLSQAGYQAEKRLWNGLQRVGIIFPYRNIAEIDSMKAVLGLKYKSGPKLFEELEE